MNSRQNGVSSGFTLIELLGVVTILAMLTLIVAPLAANIISQNNDDLYQLQIRNIKSAASNFVSNNFLSLNISNGDSLGISLGKLRDLGFADEEIKNPITGELFSDDLVIIIGKTEMGYEYTVCTGDVNCDANIEMY